MNLATGFGQIQGPLGRGDLMAPERID